MRSQFYVVVIDNGQDYEDKSNWNAGVFTTLEKALEAGAKEVKSLRKSSWDYHYFTVEQWKGSERIAVWDDQGKDIGW